LTSYQRLRDDHGLVSSKSSLRRFIWSTFGEEVAKAAVRVLRDTAPAGEEAQVDYGLLGRRFDPDAGRLRRVWGHLMVLSLSRILFLLPVLKMNEALWVEAHVAAFVFLGVFVTRVVSDNLKTGVMRPDLYGRKSTTLSRSSPPATTASSIPLGRSSPRSKELLLSPGTPSSPAGPKSSPALPSCSATPCALAETWPTGVRVPGVRPCRSASPVRRRAEGRADHSSPPPGRLGPVVDKHGHPRHPHQGGQGSVVGGVAFHRQSSRRQARRP
jgi:hypothetical protein